MREKWNELKDLGYLNTPFTPLNSAEAGNKGKGNKGKGHSGDAPGQSGDAPGQNKDNITLKEFFKNLGKEDEEVREIITKVVYFRPKFKFESRLNNPLRGFKSYTEIEENNKFYYESNSPVLDVIMEIGKMTTTLADYIIVTPGEEEIVTPETTNVHGIR